MNGHISVSDVNGATVVNFTDKHIIQETGIKETGEELLSLVDKEGKKKILLDFSGVDFISSVLLAALINLDKKMRATGGKLAMCGMRPEIFELFCITKLDRLFDIHDDLQAALSQFS